MKPISASDPDGVFEIQAELLTSYRDRIVADATRIRAQCATIADFAEAASGYIGEIGNNCPEPTTRAAIKRLATLKFQQMEAAWPTTP